MSPIRYRCDACGNLTRFTVVKTVKSRAFYHYAVSGKLTIEDEEILSEDVEEVLCRWCGHGKGIETLEGPLD